MSEDRLETLELNPEGDVKASIIWLHGLGADMNDFRPIVPEIGLPDSLGVRYIFPNAPMRAVTINAGMVMRTWYDIIDIGADVEQDEKGIRDSQAAVEVLLQREKDRGIPAERIIASGFAMFFPAIVGAVPCDGWKSA